jgi:hypothetical protein
MCLAKSWLVIGSDLFGYLKLVLGGATNLCSQVTAGCLCFDMDLHVIAYSSTVHFFNTDVPLCTSKVHVDIVGISSILRHDTRRTH